MTALLTCTALQINLLISPSLYLFTFFVAPYSLKIISTSLKMYTISWSIPDPQTIRRYYANYSASNESSKMLNISREMTSVTVAVEFDKRYTFQIQIETEAYRRSDITSETWLSHSGMPYQCYLNLVMHRKLQRIKKMSRYMHESSSVIQSSMQPRKKSNTRDLTP